MLLDLASIGGCHHGEQRLRGDLVRRPVRRLGELGLDFGKLVPVLVDTVVEARADLRKGVREQAFAPGLGIADVRPQLLEPILVSKP